MAAEKLGRGVKDNVRAKIERATEIRCRESGINHQRQAVLVCYGSDFWDIQDFEPGISQGLTEQQSSFGADRPREGTQVSRIDKCGVNAESPQRIVEQVVGAAVHRLGRDNMRPGAHQCGDREMTGGLAAGRGDGTDTAFQCCNSFLENGVGRIADA